MFTRVKPLMYPSRSSYRNVIINIFYSLFFFTFKSFMKDLILFIFLILIDFLKIIYFPITLLFYFSKYRFIELNHSQIGTVNQNLNIMVKKNLLNGYKSIILIPKYSNFNFVKEIFKNLIIIDNNLLNILLLPIKHSQLVSCKSASLDPTFLNANLELVNTAPMARVYSEYEKKKKIKDTLYDFNDDFEKKMKDHMKANYSNFKISKTFIFHHRENYHANTSNLRGSNILSYVPSIKYLLKKGYGVIRLTHSTSKKLIFEKKNYTEINTDLDFNKRLQYYLISKSRGFICCDSGPGAIGTLLSVPTYNTNMQGTIVSATTNKSIFILKKIKLRKKFISYKKAIDLNYFKGHHICTNYLKKNGFEIVDNSKSEILKGLKEFEKLKIKKKQTKRQKKFKELIPDYMELKHYKSNIADSFIKDNMKFFFNLI